MFYARFALPLMLVMDTYPLLDSQLGVLLACGTMPETTAWNLPSVMVFDKTISAERLLQAITTICESRTELHVQFLRMEDGTIRQYADFSMPIPVHHSKMKDKEAEDYMKKGFVHPFQLFSHQPLCRFEIVETERRNLLLSDLHHSIADGFTIARQLIGTDLPAAYNRLPLLQPKMTLFDWALREQEEMGNPAYTRAKDFFQTCFADGEATRLSTAHSEANGKGIMAKTSLSMSAVDDWCAARNISSYHFLMAAFCLTLSKLSHQKRVIFCTLNHGRYDKRLGEAYGMFVNTMPFVADIDGSMTVGLLVALIKKRLMDNYRHRTYPFTHFCSDLGMVPKITFGFQSNGILEQTVINGQLYKGMQLSRHDSQSDLSVMVYSSSDEYEIRTEASDALYCQSELQRFCIALHHCIDELMLNENKPIGEIDLVDEHQKKQLLALSAGKQTDIDTEQTIVSMFLRQAKKTPHAIAVDDTVSQLTYNELEIRSRALAHQLVNDGVRQGSFVGLDTTPCCEFLVAALAVMRAGGAYVPLDAQWPPKRLKHIINDAAIQIVVDASYVRAHADMDESVSPIDNSVSQGYAYMIYTSGTTGMPKGVVITHMGLTNLACFCVRRWPLICNSRIACHSTLAFDASVEDIFPILTVGGCVVFVPTEVRTDFHDLAHFLRQHKITGGCFTTRFGVALAETHSISMDYFCLGGEKLMSNPNIKGRVYNTYGPTEFTVDATYFELENDRVYDDIPIGRPVDNCHAFVVDTFGCLLPQGAVGELWLAGPQVSAGYRNAPELNMEKFTTCDFYNGMVYHTGDLARWNEEGLLEYMGRLDNQVKIDGMRISLEEIEQCLLEIPQINEVAVVARDINGKPQIQAFYTSSNALTENEIIQIIKGFLPSQMIPKQLVRIEKMPLTASGKIDKNRLHAEMTHLPEVAPADATEWAMCQLMAKVLGMQQIGATDDFFALGGTSLSAMQLVAEARKQGFSLEYGDIFAHPTPRLLGQSVNKTGENHLYDVGNYDYSDINLLLSQKKTCCGESLPNGGTLLLTGATGFLGIHVLARFLASGKWKVTCMLRDEDENEAWERLMCRWTYYFGQAKLDQERVSITYGDLTQPSSLEKLEKTPFDVVINCAADVRYFAKDNNIRMVNADGVEYLAKLCMKKDIRLIQISTLSIGGIDSIGNPSALSPSSLYLHQRMHDQYSYSKFIAERYILEQMAHDELKANIIRVGYLTPNSQNGKAPVNAQENMFFSLLQMMKLIGGCPESASRMEIEWAHVDEVADMVYMATVACPSHPVLHGECLKRSSMKQMADDFAGKELAIVPDDDFRHRLLCQHKTGVWEHLLNLMLNKKKLH